MVQQIAAGFERFTPVGLKAVVNCSFWLGLVFLNTCLGCSLRLISHYFGLRELLGA